MQVLEYKGDDWATYGTEIDNLVELGAEGTGGHSGGQGGVHPGGHTPWGVKSSQGERQSMEDTWAVHLPFVVGKAEALTCVQSPEGAMVCRPDASMPSSPTDQPALLFFAVYDGHGGREVAEHCSQHLHKNFAEQLAKGGGPSSSSEAGIKHSSEREGDAGPATPAGGEQAPEPAQTDCEVSSSGDDMRGRQEEGGRASSSGGISGGGVQAVVEALRSAFLATDQALAGTDAGDYVGATAVVAVVGDRHLYIAHVGDSRAVIQRNGEAEPLTKDHRPDREDEAARVRAAGGRIVYNSGTYRIMGMLAMSRAIGDHFLRPYVIAEPEIAVIVRQPEDEVLVIATDGLWDVFSCKEATSLAHRCIARSKDRGMSRYGGCRVAASVLTKVAMERGSRDNITVIVVDITQAPDNASALTEPAELLVGSSTEAPEQLDPNGGGYSVGVMLKRPDSQRHVSGSGAGTAGCEARSGGGGSGSGGGGEGGGGGGDGQGSTSQLTTRDGGRGRAQQCGGLQGVEGTSGRGLVAGAALGADAGTAGTSHDDGVHVSDQAAASAAAGPSGTQTLHPQAATQRHQQDEGHQSLCCGPSVGCGPGDEPLATHSGDLKQQQQQQQQQHGLDGSSSQGVGPTDGASPFSNSAAVGAAGAAGVKRKALQSDTWDAKRMQMQRCQGTASAPVPRQPSGGVLPCKV